MSSKRIWKQCTFCSSGRKRCLACGGSGKVSPGWQKCSDCNGFGSSLCINCGGGGGKWDAVWAD